MAFEEFAFRKVLGLATYLSLGKVLSAPVRSRAQEAGVVRAERIRVRAWGRDIWEKEVIGPRSKISHK